MPKLVILLITLLGSSCIYAERLPADPTKPLATYVSVGDIKKPEQGYVLSSLIVGKRIPSAIINGQRVQKGDLVDGAEVVEINRTGVKLNTGSEYQMISLAERKGFSKVKSGK
ncbi:hypothetical protein ACMXYR_16145 [Neptuniibacter sp. QD29_5]|uniref:hypothetical protein n=1 Tax=unclassified Neptuniibacter TaxID=2630693 RepID=UPI0039F5DF42